MIDLSGVREQFERALNSQLNIKARQDVENIEKIGEIKEEMEDSPLKHLPIMLKIDHFIDNMTDVFIVNNNLLLNYQDYVKNLFESTELQGEEGEDFVEKIKELEEMIESLQEIKKKLKDENKDLKDKMNNIESDTAKKQDHTKETQEKIETKVNRVNKTTHKTLQPKI